MLLAVSMKQHVMTQLKGDDSVLLRLFLDGKTLNLT